MLALTSDLRYIYTHSAGSIQRKNKKQIGSLRAVQQDWSLM